MEEFVMVTRAPTWIETCRANKTRGENLVGYWFVIFFCSGILIGKML